MTFEEKLDKLMERHEALSQTVELIGHELRTLTQNVNKLVEVSNRDAVDILKLANIAQDHEDRIKDLEQGH